MPFSEADATEISTLSAYTESDYHAEARKNSKTYDVKTVSLNDLLNRYQAPSNLDYLSIDTEGSEYDILNAFDFDKYNFKIITCEHAWMPRREKIYALLTAKGYIRKFERISRWDDWYVKAE